MTDRRRGERLAFDWRHGAFARGQTTRVEVRFAPVGEETRVTIRYFGWLEIRDNAARHRFPDAITQIRAADWWRQSPDSFSRRALQLLSSGTYAQSLRRPVSFFCTSSSRAM